MLCRVDGDKWVTGGNVIEGGGSGTVRVIIPQNKSVPDYIRETIIGMNGLDIMLCVIIFQFLLKH